MAPHAVNEIEPMEAERNKALGYFTWPPSCHVNTLHSLFPLQFFNMFNVLQRKYQQDFENLKDQIYFMETETPQYKVNKQAGVAASKV